MTQAMETVIKKSILVEAPAERRKPRRLRRRAGLCAHRGLLGRESGLAPSSTPRALPRARA